jgi:hypothetical protein
VSNSVRLPRLLWQIGAGYLLVIAILPLGYLPIRFRPSSWNVLLEFTSLLVLITWMSIGRCVSRLTLGAAQLCVPGMLRMQWLSVAGAVICTILWLLLCVGLLHGPLLLWFATIVYSICAGLLVSMFGGARWQLPLYLFCLGIAICIGFPWSGQSFVRQLLGPMAIAMALLVAWRLRVLVNAFDAGPNTDALRYLASGKWTMWAAWSAQSGPAQAEGARSLRSRAVRPTSINAFRVVLGSPLKLDALFAWLVLAALPGILVLRDRDLAIIFVKYFLGSQVWLATMIGTMFCVARARRLGELLWSQNRELPDLALLPGLGNRRMQRHALLHEALLRPLIIYSLWFGSLIICWSLVARAVEAPPQSILSLAVAALCVLLLSTMLSTGVLCRAVGRSSPWFKGLAYVVVIPPFLSALLPAGVCAPSWSCAHASALSHIVWQGAAYTVALAAIAAPLPAWIMQLKRRPNLFCQ